MTNGEIMEMLQTERAQEQPRSMSFDQIVRKIRTATTETERDEYRKILMGWN